MSTVIQPAQTLKRCLTALILLGSALVLVACGTLAPAITPAPSPTPVPFWQSISGLDDAACAYDTPYTFFYHEGGRDLLVYFEGGGACINRTTCQPGSTWFKAFAVEEADFYFRYFNRGIFDFDDPANPFRDYSVVWIPYCTGDAHIGSAVREYGDDLSIQHKGFANAQAVLRFIQQRIAKPESIFVTGCSAGSVGSAVAAPYFIEAYPDTPLVHLGDSMGGLFTNPLDIEQFWGAQASLPDWIPDTPSASAFVLPRYYTALAQHYPQVTFAQYNSQFDRLQSLYMLNPFIGGFINNSMTQISAAAQNFRYFVAGGNQHCILQWEDFYSYAAEGQRIADWVRDLAQGKPVASVHCQNCDEPQHISDS